MLFVSALEFLFRFFKFCIFCEQLRIGIIMLAQRILTAWIVLCAFPCKDIWSPILLIFTTLCGVMGVVHVPMLLAEDAVLHIHEALLWDSIADSDHLFLGRTSSLHTRLSPFKSLFSQEGFLMTSSASINLRTLWGSVAPAVHQCLGTTILRM
jgi:hypothetical protein